MRILFILALFLFLGKTAGAQWKSYILSPRGDTLNCVDQKGLKQGPWVVHVDDLRGERGYEEEGWFINSIKEGIWKKFSLEGDLIAIETFRFGMKHGKSMYFNMSGEPLREENWRAIDPNSPYDTVDVRDVNDPSIITGRVVVKMEPNSYKNGTWIYYNTMNGTIERTEEWVMDKPKSNVEVVKVIDADDMAPIDVTGTKTTAKKDDKKTSTSAKPQAVLDYEKKNSGKKKIKVRDGSTGG
jgi:hypothetical protein